MDEICCLMNFVFNQSHSLCFLIGKTNKEFNLRHDWNSLVSDDEALRMTRYSKEFFPHADVLVNLLFGKLFLVLLPWGAINVGPTDIRPKSISILPS